MKTTITHKKENPLLKRTEVTGSIIFDKETPSNVMLTESLAAELKADKETIAIKRITTKFGTTAADFRAYAYKDAAQKTAIEPKKKEKKEGAAAEPAKA